MTEEKMRRTIRKIAKNYESVEQSLVNQLMLETPNHQYTTGSYRETVWRGLFEMIIPKKYCIEQGIFIIDSYGKISSEVDLAIFDETYTPYIFNYGKIKFIPIEAVAIVIQCKSRVTGKEMLRNLEEWSDSIGQLKTSLNSVTRTISDLIDNYDFDLMKHDNNKNLMQTSTRPVRILCSTSITNPIQEKLKDKFDIFLYVEKERLVRIIPKETECLLFWNSQLNHYGYERYSNDMNEMKYMEFRQQAETNMKSHNAIRKRKLSDLLIRDKKEENIIMSLTFQLNQLLMLINNPILFPHRAYVKRFNDILGEAEDSVVLTETENQEEEP